MPSIYGIPEDPERDKWNAQRVYNYLTAKINAEKLNPADDYDSERELVLLKEIALSECNWMQRCNLVSLLELPENDNDE